MHLRQGPWSRSLRGPSEGARPGHRGLETSSAPPSQQASDPRREGCLWVLELAVPLNWDLPEGGHSGPPRHREDI